MNASLSLLAQAAARPATPTQPWTPHPQYRALDEREEYLKAELALVREQKRQIAAQLFAGQPHQNPEAVRP